MVVVEFDTVVADTLVTKSVGSGVVVVALVGAVEGTGDKITLTGAL
jgi:hypothetical protein